MSAIPPLNDNFRARQRVAFEPEHPAPFFRGFAVGLLLETLAVAVIFGAAYLGWLATP